MVITTKETSRHRSPAYPAFNLKTAIEKAVLVYEAHRRVSVEPDTLKRTMGYEVTTSHSMRAISALIQFGLLEEEGNAAARKLKLSELGLNIVLRKETDLDRVGLLRKAAMKPVIYKQMLDLWKDDLPSDDTISNYLLFTKNFNPAVVPAVLRDFKATFNFARLGWSSGWKTPGRDEPAADTTGGAPRAENASNANLTGSANDNNTVQVPALASDMRRYQLPLPHGRQAAIEVPKDATNADIEFISRYLSLMKEAMSNETEIAKEA